MLEAGIKALAESKAAEEAKAKAGREVRELAARLQAEEAAGTKAADEEKAKPAAKPRKEGGGSAKSIWFYTSEGDRLGPVTFDELRDMAKNGTLDPRLDMAWKEGLDAWKPTGQIDGLFERRSRPGEPLETLAPPPVASSAATQPTMMKVVTKGSRRRVFLLVSILFPIGWTFALDVGRPILKGQFGEERMEMILYYAQFLPLLVIAFFVLRRFTNLGMSPLWIIASVAPGLNLWLGYRCFACPAGYAYHKKMDDAGIALAILYWLFVLLILLSIAVLVAILFSVIKNPEVQQQIREAIEPFLKMPAKT
jgi:hypothetical protein